MVKWHSWLVALLILTVASASIFTEHDVLHWNGSRRHELHELYPKPHLPPQTFCIKYGDWRDQDPASLDGKKFIRTDSKNDPGKLILEERGYKLLLQTHREDRCTHIWVRIGLPMVEEHDYPLSGFSALRDSQTLGRIILFSTEVNQKDNFAKSVAQMQERFTVEEFDFHPVTYLLPGDTEKLARDIEERPSGKWIVKPVFGGRGEGIHMLTASTKEEVWPLLTSRYLAQRYIPNPLLVDGFKFTLRLYVLVTSVNPLRMYLHSNGVQKFATIPFNTDVTAHADKNKLMHVTNQAQNEGKQEFLIDQHDHMVDNIGSRRSIAAFRRHCRAVGIDDVALFARIEDVLVKSILAVEGKVAKAQEAMVPNKRGTHQLLGVDVDIDADLKPWLIESNVNPSITSDAAFDKYNKLNLLNEVHDMVGVTKFDVSRFKNDLGKHILEQNGMGTTESCLEAMAPNGCLQPEQLREIVDLEYESLFQGSFKRLFPRADTVDKYLKYFESVHPADELLAEWVKRQLMTHPREELTMGAL